MLVMLLPWVMAVGPVAPSLAESAGPAGVWAMVVDVGSTSKVPFAGTTEVITRTLLHVSLVQSGGTWVQRQQVCDVKVLSDSRSKVLLPETFIRSLPIQEYPISIAADEGAWSYRADPGPSVVGYDPARTGGGLPLDANAPGVLDPDRDGQPGVTVLLDIPVFGSVQMYVVQRGHSKYVGRFQGSVATGSVEVVRVDQRTLGASFPPFAANPEVSPVPSRSRFRMDRIVQAADCQALKRDWKGDFGVGDSLKARAGT
jgi:hypothetical protein